ncbi:MAG: translation initiation factor IF-6 [Infirmifilum sp.]|jgi:translation initiation factor 6|uniref:Translation initiation factor 6 n=1 Tax=Infirmifilum uzonense TaxID=1550241 RepID=A0A0F7FI08_9CREN|nr:translation initiation factor IF-6 [Infirmifilum uzonense]AKG39002.1 hypothetical protein MA03_06755 [Infirmifilum uzonense]
MFSVELVEIYGTPQVGIFIFANDKYALVPPDIPEKLEAKVREALEVEILKVSVAGSRLIGSLACGNNSGIVLPRNVLDSELEIIKNNLKLNVTVLEGVKETGLGNLVLANDNACLVSPLLPKNASKLISDTLGVECVVADLGGSPFVGSLAVVTNRGLALPPFVSDDELKRLEKIFKVQGGLLTINKGRMFLRSGLVANTKGALAGSETTGHELMQIQRIFSQS